MAVYTEVPDEELASFIAGYDIGGLVSCKGIAEGVENSNYLLQTDAGRFILTLYEKRVNEADLPFFLALMTHLAKNGISTPLPVKARDGEALRRLAGRPAVLVTFLEGMSARRPNAEQCGQLGEALAMLEEGRSPGEIEQLIAVVERENEKLGPRRARCGLAMQTRQRNIAIGTRNSILDFLEDDVMALQEILDQE
jgi:homoserine kinase type II